MYSDAKLLVVDDNNINLYVINQLLQEFGVEADCVPNGKACIKKVSKKQYDIIFMDHMMPEMDGIETFAKLKENSEFATPVIVLTANAGDEYADLYRKEGFAEYLVKPVEKDVLGKILAKYLGASEGKMEENVAGPVDSNKRDKLIECGFAEIDALIETGMPIEEFETLLSIFKEESLDKLADADEYAKTNNMREYAVIVHGLKNDAGMISDMELKEHALSHEIESKAGNLAYVQEEWPKLKKHWNETIARIDKYFN